jgi:hypothetical protein
MSSRTLLVAVVALAASAAALPALAEDAPASPATGATAPADPAPAARPVPLRGTIMFNLLDRNGDGAIDQDEMLVLEKAIFTALDANGDGKLSADEFRRVAAALGNGGPGRNGPGMRGPMVGHGMDGHGRFGKGDGHGPRQFMQGPRGDRQDGMNWNRGPWPRHTGQQLGQNTDATPAPGDAPADFATLDRNGDGVLSLDEFSAGAPTAPDQAQ